MTKTLLVKIMNDFFFENPHLLPKHGKEGDAGLDVRSMEDYNLNPGEFRKFPLGIGLELPEGTFARVEGRSGNAVNFGIDTIGNIIDCNYRGEISAIVVNNSKKVFEIKRGDRIAQIIVQPYINCIVEQREELSYSERGEKGFGSSGNQ